LDDDDQFIVDGEGSDLIRIRIIGGQNNDVYTIENGKKIRVYDHLNKPNTIAKRGGASFRLGDIYSNNIYDFEKYIKRVNTMFPSVASNADDGYMIGLKDTFIIRGFKDMPFHQKHIFGAQYFVSTQGFDVSYLGEIANTFGRWNLVVGGRFASENFTQNFFGFGNETINLDDAVDLNYNRVRSGILKGMIGVVKNGHFGSKLSLTGSVEHIEIEPTKGRFVTSLFQFMPSVFETKTFGIADVTYSFSGYDNPVFPTRGMFFNVSAGATSNLEDTDSTFGYVKPSVEFYNSLIRSRKLVLKTMAQGQFNIGDNFEFYQAAVLGSDTGLRGFREQRFSGNSAVAFGADLRLSLLKFKTGLVPFELGVFGGYDYGRVWVEGEDSNIWHDSMGGGLLVNAVDTLTGSLSVFNSDDGLRIALALG
jgi:Outer membrane protein/protective antigen OMA87